MSDHVAIVGIGCLFPGATDLATYWRHIAAGVDGLSEVPEGHSWSVDDYYSADPSAPDKTWATRGGFLDRVPFDPVAFGIPPNQLESIDTTQLLSLIVARHALADAGLDPDGGTWDREKVACIIGITGTQEMAITAGSRLQGPIWRKSMLRCGVDPALVDVIEKDIGNHFPTWTEQTFPGLLGNVVAGRITNRLGLGGTNAVVDAACASSLAAMQYAIGDLVAGRSDVVLTGGADTLNDAFMFQCFTRTPAFTKSGDARPFDAAADGILIGEGIAITALKRLDDAERDGDRIYAVIKAIGSSSDGRSRSIYAPNPAGQAKALRRTYAAADVSPATVELVEAHGTGTKAGDVAEVTALKEVYREARPEGRWVALGSVKSQIGHTKSTAGAAGLVKAALALHQRVLPPAAKVTEPNPKMGFEDSPFYLSPTARPWVRAADHPRRAAVSAFGFGGSNYHAVLEEHVGSPVQVMGQSPTELFLLGADNDDALRTALRALPGDAPTVTHASREVLSRWTARAPRVVAFLASSLDEVRQRVDRALQRLDGAPAGPRDELWLGGGEAPSVGFVFPGQGSQYVAMGGSAATRHPRLRQALDDADEAMRQAGREALSSRLFPAPAYDDATRAAQEDALRDTAWAQPAIGAVSLGLLDTLRAFGVDAEIVAGHSYGELTALHAAGVLDRDDFFAASRVRGELMGAGDADRGTMAAVRGALSRIDEVLQGHPEVVLANRNHPEQGVISGPRAAVEAASAALQAAGLVTQALPVAAAFHSPLVADAVAPFAEALSGLALRACHCTVLSCVTAAPYGANDNVRDVLAQQIVRPVNWVGTIRAMADRGVTCFVEVGPGRVLGGLVAKTLGSEPTVVSLDRQRGEAHGDLQLKRALAELAAAGVPVDPAPLLAERPPADPLVAGSTATVWLAGANHKNPETLSPPMPDLPKPKAPVPATAGGWGDVPTGTAPMSKPVHLERAADPRTEPTATLPTPPAAAPVASGELAALLESTRQTLSAFQAAQDKTADVHAQFLEATAKANDNFARLFEAQARLLELASGGVPLPRTALPTVAPLPVAPPTPAPAPVVASPPPPAPPTGDLFMDGWDTGRVSLPSTATTGVSSDLPPLFDAAAAVAGKSSAPAPAAATGVSRQVLVDAMLASVAEKTGYPTDMLELSMNLEGDLGIDSIKRVEILSAVRDRVPSLPELDNDRMGALRTLDEVVGYLEEVGGGASAPAPTSGVSRQVLVDAMLASVAEKTGYPTDMLELSMNLEGDLGIDSIKRVEILSAVRDRVPGLPELDNDRMGALRTLDEVVSYLEEVGGAAPAPPATAPSLGVTRQQLVEAMFASVADKTGYPTDMLELSMNLEGDLGIDSIKRVEILSAVRDRVPGLPELDNDRMGALRTLDEVVGYLAEVAGTPNAGGGAPALPSFLMRPEALDRATLQSAVLDAIAAKTGYPRETLELSMQLEGDLGIDSIKRVEILSAVRDAQPSLPELDNDRLSSLRTVAEVVEHLVHEAAGLGFAHIGEGPSAGGPALLVPPAGTPVAPPLPAGPPPVQSASDVVVAVPPALRRRVVRAVGAAEGQPVAPGPWAFVHAPPALIEALAARGVTEVPLGDRTCRGVVVVDCDTDEVLEQAFLAAQQAPADGRFATVSFRDGRFGRREARGAGRGTALTGLAKTYALERSDAQVVAIDAHLSVGLERVAEELLTDRGVVEVGLAEEGVCTLVAADETAPAPGTSPLAEGDLVVVSGGARGVTAAVVQALAAQRVALLLLGRSEVAASDPAWAAGHGDDALLGAALAAERAEGRSPSPRELQRQVSAVQRAREARATLDAAREAGAQVAYAAVDVRDDEAVAEAVRGVVEVHGPVRALIHGAGVLADRRIENKDLEGFRSVLATKLDGLQALLAACDLDELKVLALFSSTAGRFGNIGQCDYAMANEALLQHALGLRHTYPDLVAKVFDWGPWDGGMVDAALKKHFATQAVGTIPLSLGARLFVDELARPDEIEVVVEGPRPRDGVLKRTFRAQAPWLDDHRISGKPVVPAAMVLEWCTAVARSVYPALCVRAVRDLAVLKGVVFDGAARTLTLAWSSSRPADGDAALDFELTSHDGPLGLPLVHYRATVELGGPLAAETHPGSNGLGATPYPHEVDEAYDRFLFHGPSLHGIDEIVGTSDHGMVAWLRTSTPAALGVADATWHTDPLAVDGTLQLMLLWVREHLGLGALPTAVGTFRQLRPFAGRVACHLTVDRSDANTGTFEATLVAEDGGVVARLQGGRYAADQRLDAAFGIGQA